MDNDSIGDSATDLKFCPLLGTNTVRKLRPRDWNLGNSLNATDGEGPGATITVKP